MVSIARKYTNRSLQFLGRGRVVGLSQKQEPLLGDTPTPRADPIPVPGRKIKLQSARTWTGWGPREGFSECVGHRPAKWALARPSVVVAKTVGGGVFGKPCTSGSCM
jgi:hypothetical protein